MGKKRKRRRSHSRTWMQRNGKYLALVVVGAVAVGTVAFALNRPEGPTASSTPRPVASVEEVDLTSVAVIGDSYTGCSEMGGCGPANYTETLHAKLGWDFTLFAAGGTGYVNPGPKEITFADRVAAVVESKPDVVIVMGGRNDILFLDELPTATTNVIGTLRAGLPESKIVIVGPITTEGAPPEISDARDIIASAAIPAGADLFIDPVADAWFLGPDAQYIGADATHPTDAGHTYMAEKLLEPLRELIVP